MTIQVSPLTGLLTLQINNCCTYFVLRIDKSNRCIVWADANTGAALRAEHQFLHNTKITRSAKNEEQAFNKSRQRFLPEGRYIGMPQMLHHLLGEPDIHTNQTFIPVETAPLEYRMTTKLQLYRSGENAGRLRRNDRRGDQQDAVSALSDSCLLRKTLQRNFSANQCLLMQPTGTSTYDKISLFGLRPPELVELFPMVGNYFEWFDIEDKTLSRKEISESLANDIRVCHWIDGIGRRVRLRKEAASFVKKWLLDGVKVSDLSNHSQVLRDHLLDLISRNEFAPHFFKDNNGAALPIVVFTRVSPNQTTKFLLHIMLVLGRFETELDFKSSSTLKDSLVRANLIDQSDFDDASQLEEASLKLQKRVVSEILPYQPVSMPGMEKFIIKTNQLVDTILSKNSMPVTDLPASILTELYNEREGELDDEWKFRKQLQLISIFDNLKKACGNSLPTQQEVMTAKKTAEHDWSPLAIPQAADQSDESYAEQQRAMTLGINAVNSYCKQFGNLSHTKGILNNGAPGAGKTFVLQAQGLYGMCRGLRVMSTSLMAVRATALGGYHIHRLFQLEVNKKGNLYRLGEVSPSLSSFTCRLLSSSLYLS